MTDAERDAIRAFILGEISREVRRAVDAVDLKTKELMAQESVQFGIRFTAQIRDEVRAALPSLKGEPGRDADPDLMQRMVDEAIAKIPPPEPGTPGVDGKDTDPEFVRAEVAKAVAAIPAPKDGKDADPVVIQRMVSDAVALIPIPKDGDPGRDGKDVDPEFIRAEVAKAVAEIPVPKDGKDGEPGRNGNDADPEVIRAEVARAVAALPVPKDGRDGEDGKDVDLLVVKALVAGEVAHAVAALPPPKDGRDGKDGITEAQLNDGIIKGLAAALSQVHLERRDFKIGDRLIGTIPFPLYARVYRPDTEYEKGDMVTWGGDLWHCNKTGTTEKPGPGDSWTLSVKKGRDGREPARMAEKGIVPVKR